MSKTSSKNQGSMFFIVLIFLVYLVICLFQINNSFTSIDKDIKTFSYPAPKSLPFDEICGMKGGVIVYSKYHTTEYGTHTQFHGTTIDCLSLNTKTERLLFKSLFLSGSGTTTNYSIEGNQEDLGLYISSMMRYLSYKACDSIELDGLQSYPLSDYWSENYYAFENSITGKMEVTCGKGKSRKVLSKRLFFRDLYEEYLLATKLKQKNSLQTK